MTSDKKQFQNGNILDGASMSATYFSTCTARGGRGWRKISDLGSHFSCCLISLMARSALFYQTCWLVRAGETCSGAQSAGDPGFVKHKHTRTLPSLPLVGTHRPLPAIVTPLMSSTNTPLPPPPPTSLFSFSSIPPPLLIFYLLSSPSSHL